MKNIRYDIAKIQSLLEQFNILTNILVTLYDPDGNIITSYPKDDCLYCSLIKSIPEGLSNCIHADMSSFAKAKQTGKCIIYKCHANLIEATAPIIHDGILLGYLMLGQISNLVEQSSLESLISTTLKNCNLKYDTVKDIAQKIPLKSDAQIMAAAKLLEVCISYILLEKMIYVSKQTFINDLNSYLLSHIDEDLSVNSICENLNISRRKLYEYSHYYLQRSIAKHIKAMRIEKAKELLETTDLPVSIISEKCGFTDYNYFCRIFKQECGCSASAHRSQHLVK